MTSLGRVGRILAGSIDPSGISVGRDSTTNYLTKSSSAQHVQSLASSSSSAATTTTTQMTDSENAKVSNRVETLSTKTNESIESTASSQPGNGCDSNKITLQGKLD